VNEKEFLRRLADEAEDTARLLSNARKRERERRVCAAFLRCAGVLFSSSDLTCPKDDPPDVCFGTAAFEVKILLGGRKIHGEWNAIARSRRNARCVDQVLEPAVQPQPFSFFDLLQLVVDELNKLTYDPRTRATLDILLYVNLKGRFLDSQSPVPNTAAIEQMGFRSVCVLIPPYAIVVTASAPAPAFLRHRIGRLQHCCMNPDIWFEL
jgi:hypothetical protein